MLDEDLIDAIAEAAIVPERWPALLQAVAGIGSAAAAAVAAIGPAGAVHAATTSNYVAAFGDYMAHGTPLPNPRLERALARRDAGFLADLDLCSAAELMSDPLYRLYLRPYGFDWTAGAVVPVPSGDTIAFIVARAAGSEPFARPAVMALDRYRPHLSRAALLASRLGLDHARTATETLAMIGLPAAVLAENGRLLAANPLLEALAPRVRSRAFDRIVLVDRAADHLLAEALAGLDGAAGATPRSIPMGAGPHGAGLIAHLVPVRRAAHEVFAAGAALLMITEIASPALPLANLLRGLFDLTPAETRLARALADGQPLRSLATGGTVALETLRTQLKAVMAKTGTRRQVDLVRLLLAVAPPGREPPPSPVRGISPAGDLD